MELREFQEKTNRELGAELLQVRKELAAANAKNIALQERLNEYYDKNESLILDNADIFNQLMAQFKISDFLELQNQELQKRLAAFERSPMDSFTINDERSYE